MRIVVFSKRQYMSKDLLDNRFGRFREIPLSLSKMGHNVTGLCLSYQKKSEGWLLDETVRWKSINATFFKLPGLLRFILAAQKLVKEADIIWACSDSFYGVIGCSLGKIYKVPVIFDIYENFGKFFVAKLPIAKQLYHWAIRESDAVTCLSNPFAKYIQNNFPTQKKAFPIEFAVRHDLFKPLNQLECRQNLGLPLDVRLVGTIGSIKKRREVDLLFDAFNHLKEKYADLHLVFAGQRDGSVLIPEGSRIHDLGSLPFEKVPELINAMDIGVVCYANDDYGKYCFPQKTREFMACQTPVIAAGVGALKELFLDKPEWLYEPGSSKSLTHTLEMRLSDLTTDYQPPPSWTDLAKKLETIMLELLEKSP